MNLRACGRSILCLLLGLAVLPGVDTPPAARASGPCDAISGEPRPPISSPTPLIAGSVIDASVSAAVSGATVKVYRCEGGAASLAGSTTTDGAGAFGFASLGGPDWYYVEVSLSGPLSGMQPASGTANPSAPIDIGPGETGLVFGFEP